MNTYLGIDYGGTKLLIGEVDTSGNVLRSRRYPTGHASQAEAVQALLAAVEDYRDHVGFVGSPQAVGAGIVGIVDNARGEWIALGHDPEGQPVPLARKLSELLDLPCQIDNDVRSATTAELLIGQGRYTRNFIYLNVGTGMAAGFVCDGHLVRGANTNAGEIGHMVVELSDRRPCPCGRRGCVENVVSGIGFTKQLSQYGRNELLVNNGGRADVQRLFDEAQKGDRICRQIIEAGADSLACVIMNLVRVSDPDTIIYGGSILANPYFLEMVKERLEPGTMRGVTNGLVASSFSTQYAGLVGAASLGMVESRLLNPQKAVPHGA